MLNPIVRAASACAALLLILAAIAASSPRYTVTDLGLLPTGANARAFSINSQGQVVGQADTSQIYERAFIWDGASGIRELPAPAGAPSSAASINSSGQVVGGVTAPTYESPVLWDSAGAMSYLDLPANCNAGFGERINNGGVVIGTAYDFIGREHAFVWDSTNGTQPIDELHKGRSALQDINNLGQSVGYTLDSQSGAEIDLMCDAEGTHVLDLAGRPVATNDRSQIAGVYRTASGRRGLFLWENGSYTDGGFLPGCLSGGVMGLSNPGQIAGFCYDAGGSRSGFVWDRTNGIVELPALPGYSGAVATDINDVGQIVGYVTSADGSHTRAVIWDPVPEPSSASALLLALSAIGCFTGLRRRSKSSMGA